MKKFKLIAIILVAILLVVSVIYTVISIKNQLNPSFRITMSSQTVIREMRALNRLETASFSIEKVVDAGTKGNVFEELLYGDRILLIASGEVIAGFDLSQMKENDVQIDGTIVSLTLPAPQVLVTKLDSSKTRVYDRKQGLLSKGNKDLESSARLAAEQVMQEAACSADILGKAAENGRRQLSALLRAFGFITITIAIPEASC